jgi:hypothetical protein
MPDDLDLKKTSFQFDKYTRQDIELLMHTRRVPTMSALIRALVAEAARQDREAFPELARRFPQEP